MTASHMQLQQTRLVKPIGLPTNRSRQFNSNGFSFDSPPAAVATAIATVIKTVPKPISTKRCLFGKPEAGSSKAIYNEEIERQRQNIINRYGFDVKTEKFVNNIKNSNNNENNCNTINNNNNSNNNNNELTDTNKIMLTSEKSEDINTRTSSSSSSASSPILTSSSLPIKEQHLRDNSYNHINNNNNINNNIKNEEDEECPNDSNFSNNLNSKIISEKNCDEARGNNNINCNNNCEKIKSNCNNNHNNNNDNKNECNFYSCNQNNNLLNNINDNKRLTTLSGVICSSPILSSSPMKSIKKSISERTQPYMKQSRMTEYKYPVKKTIIINSTEKPKPQRATILDNHPNINIKDDQIEDTLNISYNFL